MRVWIRAPEDGTVLVLDRPPEPGQGIGLRLGRRRHAEVWLGLSENLQ